MKIKGIKWKEEAGDISELISDGYRADDIAFIYGVHRSLIYKVLEKYNIEPGGRLKNNFLRGKSIEFKWLNRTLANKGFSKEERIDLLNIIKIPQFCPILDIKLDYDNKIYKKDNSPSLDRIDSNGGYTKDNIHVISERANRIKNDSTPDELIKIANYILSFDKK